MPQQKSKPCEVSRLTAPCGDSLMGEIRSTTHAGTHLMIPKEKRHPAQPA